MAGPESIIEILALENYSGKKTSVDNDYRGALRFVGADFSTSGFRRYVNPVCVSPGEKALVRIRLPLLPREIAEAWLTPGREYGIEEGDRVVGQGRILEVYRVPVGADF